VTNTERAAAANTDWIVGSWRLLRCEAPVEIEPGTQMTFAAPAEMQYSIPTAQGPLRVELRWRIDGSMLHTEHLDGTNAVEVAVAHGAGDVLTFDFRGPKAWFVRETV